MKKGKGKKKFIDKKNATTFVILNRGGPAESSNEKPGSDHVFVPVRPPNYPRGKKWTPEITVDDLDGSSSRKAIDERELVGDGEAGEVGVKVGNFRADDFALGEYGFPDDGYDYSQHFSTMGGGKFFAAARMGDVTAANRKEKTNAKASDITFEAPAPAVPDFVPVTAVKDGGKLEVDKSLEHQFSDAESDELEVLQALEESSEEDPNWKLQDDFMAAAMNKKPVKPSVRFADANFEDDDEEDESYEDDDDEMFRGVATHVGPRVVQFEERRGEGMVDGYLDYLMEREYADEKLGEGAEELLFADSEYRGNVYANDLGGILDEYLYQKRLPSHAAYHIGAEVDEETRRKVLELAARAEEESSEEIVTEVVRDPQWDCETILSTYSNVANHPKLIESGAGVRREKKEGSTKPVRFADQKNDDASSNDDDDEEEDEYEEEPVNKGVARPKTETAAEKKARKAAVKEERRRARETKKKTKAIYRSETAAQKKHVESVPFYSQTKIPL